MNIGLMYTLLLEATAGSELSFQIQYNLTFTEVIISTNVSSLAIYINDTLVFTGLILTSPLILNAKDVIKFIVTRDQSQLSKLELIGNTLP